MSKICFMVMPYGIKANANSGGKGPASIDFNALWEKVFQPLIKDLGYDAIRADQDLGALIIVEMIERLAVADLVIADVTIPNGNVYYEIGIRHAARDTGCVITAADWSKQLFDIDQMRRIGYPLPEGEITDATASAIRDELERAGRLKALTEGRSPVFQSLPWYPGMPAEEKQRELRDLVQQLSTFQEKATAARRAPKSQRVAKALELRDEYKDVAVKLPAMALELLYVLRDSSQWQATIDFIDSLPPAIRDLPVMSEQRSLAASKMGDHLKAIAILEKLIEDHGDTSERRGLLGGRYKKLFEDPSDAIDADERAGYLDKAIEEYSRGMKLDLNDYYPSSNLPRLYRQRSSQGDEDSAQAAATIALMGCERARAINPRDQWINPTLLGAAFDAGDIQKARALAQEVRRDGVANFHLDTTIKDLERSVHLTKNPSVQSELAALLEDLKRLL